ncbi:Uncharacterised protein [Klebsiella pneumoniae]|uniref:Uncharacterized protein n=1 Tax=Klebsiella pneumoniae TaxID=573 RepID=A0A3S4GLF3_KLEPN|nr:Uncharacterised protein [Klebsiella pneumoniae]
MPKFFTRDFQQRIAQGRLQADVRDFITGMHNIIDPQQQPYGRVRRPDATGRNPQR